LDGVKVVDILEALPEDTKLQVASIDWSDEELSIAVTNKDEDVQARLITSSTSNAKME